MYFKYDKQGLSFTYYDTMTNTQRSRPGNGCSAAASSAVAPPTRAATSRSAATACQAAWSFIPPCRVRVSGCSGAITTPLCCHAAARILFGNQSPPQPRRVAPATPGGHGGVVKQRLHADASLRRGRASCMIWSRQHVCEPYRHVQHGCG